VQGTAGMSKLAPGKAGEMAAAVLDSIPLGRMGTKGDIALACVYLASSAASFVSGAAPFHPVQTLPLRSL
jgi:NAD(P)-dependent dehydrogenase (short-subunit alcohol dehydrogenase family)